MPTKAAWNALPSMIKRRDDEDRLAKLRMEEMRQTGQTLRTNISEANQNYRYGSVSGNKEADLNLSESNSLRDNARQSIADRLSAQSDAEQLAYDREKDASAAAAAADKAKADRSLDLAKLAMQSFKDQGAAVITPEEWQKRLNMISSSVSGTGVVQSPMTAPVKKKKDVDDISSILD